MKGLKNIVNSDAAYEILDSSNCAGSTWTSGGCAILAQALNKLEGYPIYVIYNTKYKGAEHFGVMTPSGSILDADGEHNNEEAWLNFFRDNEMPRPGDLIVIPFKSGVEMDGVNFDEEASNRLAELIKSHEMIRESVRSVLRENPQLADKVYFNPGKLSPKVREIINKITGGDPYTKIITDIYYAILQDSHAVGDWAVRYLDDRNAEIDRTEKKIENDILGIDDLKKVKSYYQQLKAYNKNVFPIKGYNPNGVKDVWDLIRALNERAKILEDIKKLPAVAIRNMRGDFRQERDSGDLQAYRNSFEYFLAYYSMLGNRDARLRKTIENKMFVANVTLDDLLRFVEEKENLVGGAKFTKNSIKKLVRDNDYDMEIVYDKGNVMVVDVTSPDGIKKVGCNSLWCFTYGKGFDSAWRDWNNYSTNDHVYVIIDFSEQPDSPEFMHVLIKPLDYQTKSEDEDVNDHKLFNMANEESYGAIGIVNQLVGEEAPFIMHFDEPVDVEGPSSKYPYEDPNQLKLDLQEVRKMVRSVLKEAFDSDYKSWKRKNVTIRGVREMGQENNAGAMLGSGLYTAALSNRDLAKKYGKVYFVVGAIPKNPKVFNTLNDWEIWFYNTLVYQFSKAKGKEFPDKRDFNAETTIESEMQKLGYDGIIIKGREMVNFTPGDVLYFENENQLSDYYDDNIRLSEVVSVFREDFAISESNLRIDEALAFIVENFLNENDEPSPTFEWDFVKSKIDDSKKYIRTKEQAYEYLIRLLEKIKSLPKSIKIKIAKYVAMSLIGILGYSAIKDAVYENIPEINKEMNMAMASYIKNSNEVEYNKLKVEPRKSSDSLVNMLKWEEGSIQEKGEPVLEAYKIGDGMITIGWGHAERIGESQFSIGQKITKEKAEELLAEDIAEAERGLNRILDDWKADSINVNINQSMYDAMTSMIFNMGIGNFRKSDFIQLVKQGKYDDAAEKILTTNVTYPGHVIRRQRESDMFSKDIQSESLMFENTSNDRGFIDWLSMKLGKKIGERLGGGMYGEVFEMGPVVIKISNREMFDSTAVESKNIPGIAKIYAHGKINVPSQFSKKGFGGLYVEVPNSSIGLGKEKVLYYLIMEKLIIDKKMEDDIDDVRWVLDQFLEKTGEGHGLPSLRILFEKRESMEFLEELSHYIYEDYPKKDANKYIETLSELVVIFRNVGEHFDWMDIHAGQFGRNKKGEIVAFDLDNPHDFTGDFYKHVVHEDVEFKDDSDEEDVWDRVKIIAKNKEGKKVGYAVLDMTMMPEYEFNTSDEDSSEYSDEELEKHFPDEYSVAKLEHLEVYPEFRKMGYGKELMDAAVKHVKSRGYKTMYLLASPIGVNKIDLDVLTDFYKNYGFEIIKDYGNSRGMVSQIDEENT